MKKNLSIILVIITLIICPKLTKAQSVYEDVVYLKNGSILHGIIIEQVPNQSLKIQTKDGNVFVFKIEEILKITKEETKSNNSKIDSGKSINEFKKLGYTNITELNFGLGLGAANDDFSFGIHTINGYQFNPYIVLGLGVGVDKYKNATFLPVFVDLRANFLNSSVTPFFEASGGYSIGFNGNKGGVILNPSIGVKIFVSSKTALNFSIGYRYQENSFNIDYGYFYNEISYKEHEGLINFKMGATF